MLKLFNNPTKFRVISFNIEYYTDWPDKKDQIIRLLKELNADIILLQEVTITQAKILSQELNLYWDEKVWHKNGVAILSKNKIFQILSISVENSSTGAIAIKINPDIWIVSLHLTDLDYLIDDIERLRELKFILDDLIKLQPKNIILGGDFNSLQDCILHELLDSKGFVDTHRDKEWAQGTWIPGDNERIDRIYVKGNFAVMSGQTIDHNDFEWLKDIGWPTGDDHRLVLTDLQIV
ncbi:MAG: endonuclease/exonuclease/phosphatase family protein [Candidatus Babeliales bacterium]|nr:endonuclease/exonuclease/phosphatase family protein [Candidatus Babeliales bacterium]